MLVNGLPHLFDQHGSMIESVERRFLGNGFFNEAWIQEIIYNNPEILPINSIEPVFGSLVPLCRELPLDSGFVDNLYINENGMLTMIECKLWNNPEARRKVIGQILDYAKDISYLEYESLNEKIVNIRNESIFQIISHKYPDLREEVFIDNVNKHIKAGRFLLLIVGDGIHEGMHKISDFLDNYAHMNFSFSLVELRVYQRTDGLCLIIPSQLLKVFELTRNIYQTNMPELVNQGIQKYNKKHKTTFSEEEYFRVLGVNVGIDLMEELKVLIQAIKEDSNFILELGKNSIKIKDIDIGFNFSTIHVNGDVKQYGCVSKSEEYGLGDLGNNYLEDLSSIFQGAIVNRTIDKWQWRVTINGKPLTLNEFVKKREDFIRLIKKYQTDISIRS
jgi:hypothetical protein